jgi:hypothetical protein
MLLVEVSFDSVASVGCVKETTSRGVYVGINESLGGVLI